MTQTAEQPKERPFLEIDAIRDTITTCKPRKLPQDQQEKWTGRKVMLKQKTNKDLTDASEVPALEVWTSGNDESIRAAGDLQAKYGMAIYAKVYGLPSEEAALQLFGINPEEMEGQLILAKATLEKLEKEYIDQGMEMEDMTNQIRILKQENEDLADSEERAQLLEKENGQIKQELAEIKAKFDQAKQTQPETPKIVPAQILGSRLEPDTADFLSNGIRDLVNPEAKSFVHYILPALLDKVEDCRVARSDMPKS